MANNKFPDIDAINVQYNPIIQSPNSSYQISFYQTQETTINTEDYKKFLDSAIRRFRSSNCYKGYKARLMDLGLDRCQVLGNINSEMATLEMHHCILTIFDVATIISNHIIATKGIITTFDLVELLKQEHCNNNIPIVMLAKTPHQLYHNNDDFYISPKSIIGNWYYLLEKYQYGITMDIAFKVLFYIKKAIDEDGMSNDHELLKLRDSITKWISNNNY